jgi:hypothetical protein
MSNAVSKPTPSARRMAEHRRRLRAKGLRQVTIWVQDKNDPVYIERCRKAVAAINTMAGTPEEWALARWSEATADWSDL